MSVNTKDPAIPGGEGAQPGGEGAAAGGEKKPDSVAYDSYLKLLDEKKKVQAKLDEYAEKEKKAKEDKLRENNEWKTILETREKELGETKAALQAKVEAETKQAKLNAVLSRIAGKIENDYQILIPIDSVVVNPATGAIDEASAEKVAKDFEAKHARVIQRANGKPTNQEAPRGNSTLSYEEWTKLPAKEMKARYSEVFPKGN